MLSESALTNKKTNKKTNNMWLFKVCKLMNHIECYCILNAGTTKAGKACLGPKGKSQTKHSPRARQNVKLKA